MTPGPTTVCLRKGAALSASLSFGMLNFVKRTVASAAEIGWLRVIFSAARPPAADKNAENGVKNVRASLAVHLSASLEERAGQGKEGRPAVNCTGENAPESIRPSDVGHDERQAERQTSLTLACVLFSFLTCLTTFRSERTEEW